MEGVYLGVVSPRQDWGRRHRLQAHMSALMEYPFASTTLVDCVARQIVSCWYSGDKCLLQCHIQGSLRIRTSSPCSSDSLDSYIKNMQILPIYLMGLAWLMENCIKWARSTWKRPSSLCAGVEIRQHSHAPKIAKCSRINHFWRGHNAIWSSCNKNRVGLATMHIKGSPPWFVWSFTFNHHHHQSTTTTSSSSSSWFLSLKLELHWFLTSNILN
jgi:hypothetical protein